MNAAATASRTEIGVVYSAAVVQGLALVTFPAASSIFTSPDGFGLDSTRYGTIFVPQVVLAILSSGLAPKLARRYSLRRVLLVGFAGNIVSMALLALTRLLLGMPDMAFAVLLVATGALGLGFGATVMALNTYAETFFPQAPQDAKYTNIPGATITSHIDPDGKKVDSLGALDGFGAPGVGVVANLNAHTVDTLSDAAGRGMAHASRRRCRHRRGPASRTRKGGGHCPRAASAARAA